MDEMKDGWMDGMMQECLSGEDSTFIKSPDKRFSYSSQNSSNISTTNPNFYLIRINIAIQNIIFIIFALSSSVLSL